MKHRATLPNAYAHDELLGKKGSLPRSAAVCDECTIGLFLFAFEIRGALFDERSRAFEMIFRREHQVLAVALVVEKIRQIQIQPDSQRFLGETLREWSLRCDSQYS